MYDLCAFGDILMDMTPMPPSPNGNYVFESNAGGTVANMAVAASRFGLNTLLIGKVGDDILGRHIQDVIAKYGVDISGVATDPQAFTTMSFVTLAGGERSFSFSRRHAADIALTMADVPVSKALDARVFHFSGMCLTDEPVRGTTFAMLDRMRARGRMITIDVNYRERLWSSEGDFVRTVPSVYPYLDVFKSSKEEILLLTGETTLEAATERIHRQGIELVVVSCGSMGAFYRLGDCCGTLNTYDTVPVDTTGAGDCFMSAMLYGLIKRGGLNGLRESELVAILDFANAAGAVSITGRGGASSMPTVAQVEHCMATVPRLEIPW